MLKLQLCGTDHVNAEVELLLHAAVAGGQVHMLLLPDSVWGDWAHWFMIFADLFDFVFDHIRKDTRDYVLALTYCSQVSDRGISNS